MAQEREAERILWSKSLGDPSSARSAQRVGLAESAKHN
jgi:hypothetical protein